MNINIPNFYPDLRVQSGYTKETGGQPEVRPGIRVQQGCIKGTRGQPAVCHCLRLHNNNRRAVSSMPWFYIKGT